MKKICLFIWLLLLMACGTEGTEKAFVAQQATSDLEKAIHEKINALPDGFENCRPGLTAKHLSHFSSEELKSLLSAEAAMIPEESPAERYLPQVQPEPCQIQPDTIEEIFFFATLHPDMTPETLAIQDQKNPNLKNDRILNSNIFFPCAVITQYQPFIHSGDPSPEVTLSLYADIILKDQRRFRTRIATVHHSQPCPTSYGSTRIYAPDVTCRGPIENYESYGSCGVGAETATEICRTSANPPFACPEFLRQEYFEKNKAANEGS